MLCILSCLPLGQKASYPGRQLLIRSPPPTECGGRGLCWLPRKGGLSLQRHSEEAEALLSQQGLRTMPWEPPPHPLSAYSKKARSLAKSLDHSEQGCSSQVAWALQETLPSLQ